jgi:polyhydroxyalkanoate synthesis regulator phasin
VAGAVSTKNRGNFMAEERSGSGGGLGDGIRSGLGILNALKEALEETLEEASRRGDFSPDRAKGAVADVVHRLQDTFDDAKEKLDFVSRKDFDALSAEVRELREQVSRHLGNQAAHGAGGAQHAQGGGGTLAGRTDVAAGDGIPVD